MATQEPNSANLQEFYKTVKSLCLSDPSFIRLPWWALISRVQTDRGNPFPVGGTDLWTIIFPLDTWGMAQFPREVLRHLLIWTNEYWEDCNQTSSKYEHHKSVIRKLRGSPRSATKADDKLQSLVTLAGWTFNAPDSIELCGWLARRGWSFGHSSLHGNGLVISGVIQMSLCLLRRVI